MAIIETGSIFHTLTFGGVNSGDYGIYITGSGVYNAPTRAVEMVEIPGRNGSVAIDQGRFDNITVTYPAGTFAGTETDFRENLSDFRNAILSQKGYQKLTDTYHPDEYREGLYVGGLEVEPAVYNTAAEFDLVFECKPQRFLTSGETAVNVSNNDVLNNPTLFDSGPLVEITGYGTVEFNGYEIEVTSEPLGEITIHDTFSIYDEPSISPYVYALTIDDSLLIAGDTFKIQEPAPGFGYTNASFFLTYYNTSAYTLSNAAIAANGVDQGYIEHASVANSEVYYYADIWASIYIPGDITFTYGTASSRTLSGTLTFTLSGQALNYSVSCVISYDGAHTLTFTFTLTKNSGTYSGTLDIGFAFSTSFPIVADSTMPAWGTVYIDCDVGEAYKYNGGELVNLNSKIALGSDLPKLAPGNNAVTFDNTISVLKITPRWWKI